MPEETVDKLVIGIQDKSTEARLLREKDLSLDKALDMCKSGEVTNKQLESLHNNGMRNSEELQLVHGLLILSCEFHIVYEANL